MYGSGKADRAPNAIMRGSDVELSLTPREFRHYKCDAIRNSLQQPHVCTGSYPSDNSVHARLRNTIVSIHYYRHSGNNPETHC